MSVRAAARAETLGHVLRSISAFAVWTIAAITVLGEVGIALGPLVAGAGIAGVALGFGAQSLVKDFLAGIFIIVEDQYGVGDIIDVGDVSGTLVSGVVESVSLRATRLRSTNGTVWHVPNGTILRVGQHEPAVGAGAARPRRWSTAPTSTRRRRSSSRRPTGCGRTPNFAGQILEEPEMWGVENLAPEGVTIRLVVKTQPAEQFKVLRELRGRIKAALDAAGIEIAVDAAHAHGAAGPGGARAPMPSVDDERLSRGVRPVAARVTSTREGVAFLGLELGRRRRRP